MNKAIIVGRLGQNPEVKFLPSGQAVSNFSVATNESWTDKEGVKQERVEWHRVVVWGKTAENCGKYLTKGRQVLVEGKIQTREWDDKAGVKKYTTEIQAQSVQFLGDGGGAKGGAPSGAAPSTAAPSTPSFNEEDIPF